MRFSQIVNLLSFCFFSTAATVTGYHRHLLHHPFFPVAAAPSPNAPLQGDFHSLSQSQPLSQWHPNPNSHPMSTSRQPNIQQYPFFPTSPPPPPPPPVSSSALVTFPANISSLLIPHVRSSASSPSSSSRKRLFISLTISLSLLFSAILVAFSAFLIFSRNRTAEPNPTVATKVANKASGRVRLFPPNVLPSDSPPPKILHRPGVPTSTSSEFLYLGTLASPNTPYFHPNLSPITTNPDIKSANVPPSQATGSPDLQPLPPLPKLCGTSSRSGEALIKATEQLHYSDDPQFNEKDEDEDFYSPKESPRVLVGQKLVDLLEVRSLKREPMLIKISVDDGARRQVLEIAANYGASAVDLSDHAITFELSEDVEKMVGFRKQLEGHGACEVVRVGELDSGSSWIRSFL